MKMATTVSFTVITVPLPQQEQQLNTSQTQNAWVRLRQMQMLRNSKYIHMYAYAKNEKHR